MFGTGKTATTPSEIEELKLAHKRELDAALNRHRDVQYQQRVEHRKILDGKTAELQCMQHDNLQNSATISQLRAELSYEKENRKLLVDAEVQKQLGQYETRYYHELHTALEERADKMQQYVETTLDKFLVAIKDNKPVATDAKVIIVGRDTFEVNQKAGADKGGNKEEKKS